MSSASERPPLLGRYLERSLTGERSAPAQVRITQEGEMRRRQGSRWMRFTAVQRFAVDRVAFSWRARFPLAGPLALTVLDEYASDDGGLDVRVLGLPVQRQRGRETVLGEALRYLAELPFTPYAIALNDELEWQQRDDDRLEVAAHASGERLVATIEIDGEGDIVRTSSEMRMFQVDKRWQRRPWGGEFSEHALLAGMRIPTRAEAYWELDGERFVYWRARVTSAELLDEPFRTERER